MHDGTPGHGFSILLGDLAGIVRNTCRTPHAESEAPTFLVGTTPSAKQQRAFELHQKIQM